MEAGLGSEVVGISVENRSITSSAVMSTPERKLPSV